MVVRNKTIDTSVLTELSADNYVGIYLVRLECDTPTGYLRYNSSNQNIYWDEGSGEEAYLGVGLLASIQPLLETSELGAVQVQLTLSGLPAEGQIAGQSIINTSFTYTYRNRKAYIYYATLDTNTYAVVGTPVVIFSGMMDTMGVVVDREMAVSVNIISRLQDWERARGGRYNQPYQHAYIDPTDCAFKFVEGLRDREVMWGGVSVIDPGSPGRPGGPGCPAPWMKLLLADGSYISARDIKPDMYVKTFHEYTMEEGIYKVLSTSIDIQPRLEIHLTKNNSDQYTKFTCSESHKFWNENDWVDAKDLEVGQILQDYIVSNIINIGEGEVVRLYIEDAHTYVCEGLLSHNKMDVDEYHLNG